MTAPALAYALHSLPGETIEQRLRWASRLGLSVEVANRTTSRDFDPAPFRQANVSIIAVQAYAMHEFHPLHPDAAARARATIHVKDSLELAARVGARYVITVCGFGQQCADAPFERSLEFFAGLAPWAAERGVRILVEPLSPLRASAMTDPAEIDRLLGTLDAPDQFGLLLDTGHLLDSERVLEDFFQTWSGQVEMIQLKGRGSTPPTAALLGSWFEALEPAPAVLSIEHREPITAAVLPGMLLHLQQRLNHLPSSMS